MAAQLGSGSFNGLSFGPGTKFHISAVAGLDDLPPVRNFDSPRPGDQGLFRGIDLLGERTITLDVGINGNDNGDYYAQVDILRGAFLLNASEMPLLFFNSTRLVNARTRRRSVPYDATAYARIGTATVELVAADPRIYDAAVQTLSTGMAQSSGGMTFPATFPLSFGSTGSGGLIQVTNLGNFGAKPVLSVQGPVDNPIMENITAGKRLRFNISLGVADILTVDLDARTVLLNGTASRRNTMTSDSQWWEIAPGANTLRFSNAGSFQAAAGLSLPFRSAWI